MCDDTERLVAERGTRLRGTEHEEESDLDVNTWYSSCACSVFRLINNLQICMFAKEVWTTTPTSFSLKMTSFLAS